MHSNARKRSVSAAGRSIASCRQQEQFLFSVFARVCLISRFCCVQAANINATFAKRQADAKALAAAEKAAALRRQRGQTAAAQAQQTRQQRLDMLRLASQAYDLAQALHKVLHMSGQILCHFCILNRGLTA